MTHISASVPAATISPLSGTPDATPSTQISFLGVPASALHGVTTKTTTRTPLPAARSVRLCV